MGPAVGDARPRAPRAPGARRLWQSDASVFGDGTQTAPREAGAAPATPSPRGHRPEGTGRASPRGAGSRRGAAAIVIVYEARAGPGAGRALAGGPRSGRVRGAGKDKDAFPGSRLPLRTAGPASPRGSRGPRPSLALHRRHEQPRHEPGFPQTPQDTPGLSLRRAQ